MFPAATDVHVDYTALERLFLEDLEAATRLANLDSLRVDFGWSGYHITNQIIDLFVSRPYTIFVRPTDVHLLLLCS